jgi:carbohydrate-selective porin OprB
MGRFSDAIAAYQADQTKNATTCPTFNYGSNNASAPDLCWVRKPNIKMGIGINIEQSITPDIGLFFRGMYSDGKTEVYSYTSSDRSISFGAAMKGIRWGREKDTLGLGFAQSWISKSHANYLNLGGIDGFIGDGKLNYKPEQVVDLYYQCHVLSSAWLSVDYQHLANPAYNADRGPVNIYGARVHFEF